MFEFLETNKNAGALESKCLMEKENFTRIKRGLPTPRVAFLKFLVYHPYFQNQKYLDNII